MNLFNAVTIANGSVAAQGHVANSRSTFVATNPTPGTGIASKAAATSRSATAGLLNIFNSTARSGSGATGNIIQPVCLMLVATQANTSGSDFTLDFYVDAANRYSSGGSAITEVAPIDSQESSFSDPTSKANIHFGELTLASATDETLVWSQRVMKTIFAANDLVYIWFGTGPSGAAFDGTHMEGNNFVVPPIWLRPGGNLSVHEYGTSQSDDPAFEFGLIWVEHPNAN